MDDIKLVNHNGDIISLKPLDGDLMVYGTMLGADCYKPIPRPLTERDRAFLLLHFQTVEIPERGA